MVYNESNKIAMRQLRSILFGSQVHDTSSPLSHFLVFEKFGYQVSIFYIPYFCTKLVT